MTITPEQLEVARAEIERVSNSKNDPNHPGTITLMPSKAWTRIVRSDKYGSRSAYGFICMADNGPFKEGDLLATAGWKAPAKNQARGNILAGKFDGCQPYGMVYLR